MKTVNQTINKTDRPVKVLQFGEGNFLRAFVEYIIDVANEKNVFDGNVQIVKAIPFGSLDALKGQDCVYTVLLRGRQDNADKVEKRVVTCVSGAVGSHEEYEKYSAIAKSNELKFIVSNTTEAGIVYDESDELALCPPKTFPGKLTKFLYERYIHFGGAADKGLIILPVELIEKNGAKLKECCLKLAGLWKLPKDFCDWLTGANKFCSTLVDRIVTGYPRDEAAALEAEFGYADKMIVTGEPFALWVIESDNPAAVEKEFPLDKAGLPVIFTNNLQPYRERKVRILNGAHTSSVLAAYLCGLNTVGEMMNDKTARAFLEKAVFDDLAPMVPLPADEVKAFAASVMERFENPYIKHNLLSIALNSVSKFKARVLPTILETQEKYGRLPNILCFSLAALMAFYCGEPDGEKLVGKRGDDLYDIMDDAPVLAFFAKNKDLAAAELATAFLSRTDFWGCDLTTVPGLAGLVGGCLQGIRDKGMRRAVEETLL